MVQNLALRLCEWALAWVVSYFSLNVARNWNVTKRLYHEQLQVIFLQIEFLLSDCLPSFLFGSWVLFFVCVSQFTGNQLLSILKH